MQNYFYDLRYQVDKVEWRARAKRELVYTLWKQFGNKNAKKVASVLDVGCGTGVLQEQFEKRFNSKAYGIDTSYKAIEYCRKRGLTRVKISDGRNIPFKGSSFNLVTAIDVLEHIRDDMQTLSETKRVLKKNGIAIFLIPAHPKLWSTRDVKLHHFRRYQERELEDKCIKAGFKILARKNVDFAIYFLFSIIHSLARKENGVTQLKMDTASTNIVFNEIMYWYEQLENKLQNFLSFPVGLSIIVVAQKIS